MHRQLHLEGKILCSKIEIDVVSSPFFSSFVKIKLILKKQEKVVNGSKSLIDQQRQIA